MLLGEGLDLVVVDVLGVLVDAVVHRVEPLAAEGDLAAVGEVAAVRQAHRQDGLAGLEERAVDRLVGAGPAVRLDVGVVGAEERGTTVDGDLLRLVDLGAAAVVATAGVALGILVGEGRAQGGEHRGAGDVLAGDELQAAADPGELGQQDARDVRVEGRQCVEIAAVELAHGVSLRLSGKGGPARSHCMPCAAPPAPSAHGAWRGAPPRGKDDRASAISGPKPGPAPQR
ncbi:MAG: hypothetical protein BWY91_02337 [bacterium ADurb.BinA028]|nr:MAG: hypothetical protein BWY91_02337 [bacterium ADurb.BinA028]